MNEWVSVKDRLPKDEDEYLIYPPGKYCGPTAMFWPYDDFNGHVKNTFELESEFGDINQIEVTHWQELPAGPK
jgi:hypothetical protein